MCGAKGHVRFTLKSGHGPSRTNFAALGSAFDRTCMGAQEIRRPDPR
jgi:hypothetical protein